MNSLNHTQIDTIVKNKDKFAISPSIRDCIPVLTRKGKPWAISDGQCRVYKVIDSNGCNKALRLWTNALGDIEKRCQEISSFIFQHKKEYFLNFEYIEQAFEFNGEIYPAILMDWCPAKSLKSYIQEHLYEKKILRKLQDNLMNMFDELHDLHISHGDLHHDNIRVGEHGELYLIDYDSVYVPTLKGYRDECEGYSGYQHPFARSTNKYLSEHIDYFSELIIILSIEALIEKPEIWNDYQVENRDQAFLFMKNDFLSIEQNQLYLLLCNQTERLNSLCKILKYFLSRNTIREMCSIKDAASKLGLSLFRILSMYCINCGQKFFAIEDLFCINCGYKRI